VVIGEPGPLDHRWRFNALVSVSDVTLRRARLVLGWVTVSGIQLPVQETYLSI